MAHNISNVRGRAAFAFANKRPWHDLGTQVPDLMKTREAIIAGDLDYDVAAHEIILPERILTGRNGEFRTLSEVKLPGVKATYRTDLNIVFGIVGSDYQIIQNREVFEFFDIALGKDAACIETVGALGNGERVFMMARMPEGFEVVPGDRVEYFLLLTTAHDGSGAVKILFTPVRVVCQNTLTAALRGARNVFSVKHTKNAKDALALAPEMLKDSEHFWKKAQEAYKAMAKKQMDPDGVKKFLVELFPAKKKEIEGENGEVKEIEASTGRVENIRAEVLELFEGKAKGANLAGTTAWGLFNAVTDYIDHSKTVRTRKDGTKPSNWEASVFGLGSSLRQKASDLLLKV